MENDDGDDLFNGIHNAKINELIGDDKHDASDKKYMERRFVY